jgi:hypothetical protein
MQRAIHRTRSKSYFSVMSCRVSISSPAKNFTQFLALHESLRRRGHRVSKQRSCSQEFHLRGDMNEVRGNAREGIERVRESVRKEEGGGCATSLRKFCNTKCKCNTNKTKKNQYTVIVFVSLSFSLMVISLSSHTSCSSFSLMVISLSSHTSCSLL